MALARHWHHPGSMSVATILKNKNLYKKRMILGKGMRHRVGLNQGVEGKGEKMQTK